jgi:hypothetical protein
MNFLSQSTKLISKSSLSKSMNKYASNVKNNFLHEKTYKHFSFYSCSILHKANEIILKNNNLYKDYIKKTKVIF